jgi:GNAT superfamily N-acetyltransferase
MLTIQPITPEQTYPLRHAVLWPDKPLSYVHLEDDPAGEHMGAFHEGELIAVISLFVNVPEARFRKFATRPDWQRRGVGTLLLNWVIDRARAAGATTLWCDARLDAAAFYRRFGMEAVGQTFYKGPVPYTKFSLTLPPC